MANSSVRRAFGARRHLGHYAAGAGNEADMQLAAARQGVGAEQHHVEQQLGAARARRRPVVGPDQARALA